MRTRILLQSAQSRSGWLHLLTLCLLSCAHAASDKAWAQFGPFAPGSDPSQPTPLQNLSSGYGAGGFNANGYSFSVAPPQQTTMGMRPSNWTGRLVRPSDGLPGASLDDAEPFRPGEAQDLARQYAEQRSRGKSLGGGNAVVSSIYGPQMQKVLVSPYILGTNEPGPLPTVTTSRPLTPTPASLPDDRQGPVPAEMVEPTARQVAHAVPVEPPAAATAPTADPLPAYVPLAQRQAAAAKQSQLAPGPAQRPAPNKKIEFSDPTMVIAKVDKDVILLGDVLMIVNERLSKAAGKISPAEIAQARLILIRQSLDPIVDVKLACADLKRKIPKEPLEKVTKKVAEMWELEEFPKKLRTAKLTTRGELEREYRRFGTTLEREKKGWIESQLAQQWVGQNIKLDQEVTHEQMLVAYRQQISEFEYAAGARWEEIKIKYGSQRERLAAWRKIAQAGNELLRGAPFPEVAKRYSQGQTAQSGGARDWTNKGSLTSTVLEEALFTTPIGRFSSIVDDKKALYIIRVIERREAGVVPFTEAQVEIKKQIREQRIRNETQQFFVKLKSQYRIWTIFDEEKRQKNSQTVQAPASNPWR